MRFHRRVLRVVAVLNNAGDEVWAGDGLRVTGYDSMIDLRDVFAKLGMGPKAVLRKRDANKAGLSGDESDDTLIGMMADNPRLLQRPIGVLGDKAAVGRPVENLLSLV